MHDRDDNSGHDYHPNQHAVVTQVVKQWNGSKDAQALRHSYFGKISKRLGRPKSDDQVVGVEREEYQNCHHCDCKQDFRF